MVIGINAEIIDTAQNIASRFRSIWQAIDAGLIADGRVIRPWIGFHGRSSARTCRTSADAARRKVCWSKWWSLASPAEKAGMEGGTMELSLGESSVLLGGDIVVSNERRSNRRR